jgi:hypothetical protein
MVGEMKATDVCFSDVLGHFDEYHKDVEMYLYTRNVLESANVFFGERWCCLELTPKLIRHHITLMYHHHPFSGLCLIPESGATVHDSAKQFSEIRKRYKRRNAFCYRHIQGLKVVPFTPVFLASRDPPGFSMPIWHTIAPPQGNFFHLDGLHRLIAWELAGRFCESRYRREQPLHAYVAGRVSEMS